MIYAVFGLPFVGKREFSRILSGYKACEVANTSDIRNKWITGPTYRLSEKRAVYLGLLQIAAESLMKGDSLVITGCFNRNEFRKDVDDLSRAFNQPVTWIYFGPIPSTISIPKTDNDRDRIRKKIADTFQFPESNSFVHVESSLEMERAMNRIEEFQQSILSIENEKI